MLKDYLLFQANYGTVYASHSEGSKSFTVLFFRAINRQ